MAFDAQTQPQHDDMDGIVAPAARRSFVGHDDAFAEMRDAFAAGRLHHAWLLQGPVGIGKATMAFAFARHILGQGADSETVGRQVAQGSHPGLLHLTRPPADKGPGFKTQIPVDEIRRLTHFFQTTAGLGWRIAIIDPADDMNRSAANALLKILEEPPARSLFLIINHMPGRLLPTIRSRCRVLRLTELTAADMRSQLQAEVPDAGDDEITAAIAGAHGSMRAGLQHLVSGGLEVSAEVRRLFGLRNVDWAGVQAMADALALKGREAAFALMVEELFATLAEASEQAMHDGDLHLAERLAAFWQSEEARFREAAAFNLDRKQTVLTFFTGLSGLRG